MGCCFVMTGVELPPDPVTLRESLYTAYVTQYCGAHRASIGIPVHFWQIYFLLAGLHTVFSGVMTTFDSVPEGFLWVYYTNPGSVPKDIIFRKTLFRVFQPHPRTRTVYI